MMIAAKARAVVNLAREIADNVPFPPGGRRPDPEAYRAWEEVMLSAASGLAVSVDYDCDVLAAAVGPKLQVGVNPPWRVLLQIAQLEARSHAARQTQRPELPPVQVPVAQAPPDHSGNVVSLHRTTADRPAVATPTLDPAAMWPDTGGWLGQPAGGLA
jgi:hypothetical protein